MNLATAFLASADHHAAKTAVYWGTEEFTYDAFQRQTRWLGRTLPQQYALTPGSRVGLLLPNCPQFIPALFGALAAGAAVVPINNFLKPPEIDFILNDAGIDLLISCAEYEETWQALLTQRPHLRVFQVEALPEAASVAVEPDHHALRTEQDLAVIIYTSGTTGRPKGAMLSHRNLLHNVESCRQVLAAVDHDRFALLLPMFHSFMLCVCILLPLLVGGSIVLIKSLHPPKNVIQEMFSRRATILPAIPQFFRALTDPSIPTQLPLRLCISGAAPLPARVLKEFNAKFPIPLLEGYGLSEASPVVSINPIPGPWKSGSIGVPIPNVEVSVQDDAGALLPVGQVGEICVRGGNVMLGYWNQPEETARTLRQGWLLTGDVGYRDADGYFFITDRKKDMLLVNGINVYPREIEEVIYHFPGVKETAVVGQPDSRRGEQAIAFVCPVEGAAIDEKQLLQFLRQQLADYKVPRRIVFLPALPRNATGKILKTTLRQMA